MIKQIRTKCLNACSDHEAFSHPYAWQDLESQSLSNAALNERITFFGLGKLHNVRPVRLGKWKDLVGGMSPILLQGNLSGFARLIRKVRGGVYWIDERRNPHAGWEWCDLAFATYMASGQAIPNRQQRFTRALNSWKAAGNGRCYVFGTGPSLATAQERSWNDGIRIVCNTIVKDRELWHHIKPHVIVAGDGIYHFGFTEFAKSFRRDLHLRLRESVDTLFLLPDRFYPIVADEFSDVGDQVIPVPVRHHDIIHYDMSRSFSFPGFPNVLNMLLLPLACSVGTDVRLWGFDGRAPTDTLFWKNSDKHTYSEHMAGLRLAHPAFFDHNVPKDNPERYVKAVHGDLLEGLLSAAERSGWKFSMLHHSYTPTLASRARL